MSPCVDGRLSALWHISRHRPNSADASSIAAPGAGHARRAKIIEEDLGLLIWSSQVLGTDFGEARFTAVLVQDLAMCRKDLTVYAMTPTLGAIAVQKFGSATEARSLLWQTAIRETIMQRLPRQAGNGVGKKSNRVWAAMLIDTHHHLKRSPGIAAS